MKYWFISVDFDREFKRYPDPVLIKTVNENVYNEFEQMLMMTSFETLCQDSIQKLNLTENITRTYKEILFPCIYNKLKYDYLFCVLKTSDNIDEIDMRKFISSMNSAGCLLEADNKFKELLG